MSDEIAIKVENVSKIFRLPHEKQSSVKSALINFHKRGYEKQQALNDVSFEVKRGEFFGIVGRNGSGKSTLLKMLAGIYLPSKGNVTVNGKLTPFIELGVGFSPELTGRENVFLNGALLGFNRKEMNKMYQDIVDFAELERFMDQKLKNYSSGMQVRLAFSIAIRAKGDILLLDEVLAVGDAAFQQKCYNYFEELKQQKKTVVFVSHSMDAIQRFCTNAIYIDNGDLTHKGAPSEIADIYLIDNINQSKKSEHDSKNNIKFSIKEESRQLVKIKTDYKCGKDKCFASLSIWKDGIYIGGISSEKSKPLKNSGNLEFTIDKKILNPGTYAIGGGLLDMKNDSLLAAVKAADRKFFLVEGKEKRRGGALKLEDTWEYES